MKKKYRIRVLLLVTIFAACVFMVIFPIYSQEDITTVEDSAFENRMRPPVPFAHDEHNEGAGIDDCSICHHVYEDGKKIEGEDSVGTECSECHLAQESRYPFDLVKAYHSMCKRCHQEKNAGPILCAECHPKN